MLLGVRLQTYPVIDILFLDVLFIFYAPIKKSWYSFISICICGMCSLHVYAFRCVCRHVHMYPYGSQAWVAFLIASHRNTELTALLL